MQQWDDRIKELAELQADAERRTAKLERWLGSKIGRKPVKQNGAYLLTAAEISDIAMPWRIILVSSGISFVAAYVLTVLLKSLLHC